MPLPRIKLPLPIRRKIVKRLTCKDVSILLSRECEQPLTTGERFWLRLHLYICTGCYNFRNNMNFMRTALKRYLEHDAQDK
jgi:hypothetical protein